ncbi:MAG: DMT family transporter [Desulfobacterales bacterium]
MQNDIKNRVYRADLLLLLTAAIWGSAFVAQRVGMNHVGPLTFNGIRFALGALVLVPLIVWRTGSNQPAHESFLTLVKGGLAAGIVLFAGATLQQIGLVYTTAGKAGFITGLYVIFVPILGFFLGLRLTSGGWLGAGLAAVGLYLLSVTESFTLATGDFWVLIGAVFWALHVLVLSYLSPKMDTIKLACAQFTVCSLLSLLGAGFTETVTLEGLKGAAVPILYGGILSVGTAYTLQVIAQKDAPAIHAAIILSLEAVFSAIFGWLLLGEVLNARAITGCGLMLSGMLIVQLCPVTVKQVRKMRKQSVETV